MIKTKLNIEALPDEFVESLATKDDINDINSALTDIDTALSDKQDVLVSGTNIKTVNGTTLLGKGNINIPIYDDTEIVQSIQEIQEHISENEEVVAEALTDLDTNKASKSDVAQMIGTSTETLETLQNITEYIVNNGQEAANLVENVQINAENIDETKKMAVDSKTLDISYAENDIDIHYNAIDGGEYSLKIEVATEESAGVMSAEDKKEQVKKTPLVNGDIIVGQTREIHSRNGKTVSDSFLARTTAGSGTIGDGVASLKSVGGNIVKNFVDGTFESGWENPNNRFTIESIENNIVCLSSANTNGTARYRFYIGQDVAGHIYYQSCFIKCSVIPNVDEVIIGVANGVGIPEAHCYAYAKDTTDWQLLSVRYNGGINLNLYGIVNIFDKRKENWGTILVYKYQYIDLTEMFGAGKEPTKEECDRMFSTMDALPQGLTIAKPTEFKSTGFNQFNPDNVLDGKTIIDNAIVSGDKKIAVIPCLPCKVGVGENNGYCIHGDFGEDIKVYLTPLNPMKIEGELYMHELTKDATTDTYVPQIKGYMLVEVPTTANLCAHFLWSEDKCERYTYEPYFESKVELPVIPQMSEWGLAGIQSSGTLVCDTIDFVRGVYIKRIGAVDLSSLDWIYAESIKRFQTYLYRRALKNNNIVVDRYTTIALAGSTGINKTIFTHPSIALIYINDDSFVDAASLKESLQGVILYYELAKPEEYPLPKFDNNYISSDYGVEQFDSVVPCNANNLYYMRSLAGETRNFLDRLYDNTDKTDAKEVADYITNSIEGNKELATNAPNLALRALFITAGAEYNDSGVDKTNTAPWGETVTHKAGHYYLNGLGDITEKQMIDIYNAGKIETLNIVGKYHHTNIRTNLPATIAIRGHEGYGTYSLAAACSGSQQLQVILLNNNSMLYTSNSFYGAFNSCPNLEYIYPILDVQNCTSTLNAFYNCRKLKHIELKSVKLNLDLSYCSNIFKSSILYIIQNAIPTTAITITLHADAYARLKDDADIVTALDTKNAALATEGKGGSINLISV